ncbi:MAG TPA: SAM-dependent methyltransferase [Lentisphaeria bacterium]|nr:SAM-dependent methyltransferase [Lentisphaeria bacterium]
MSVSYQATQDHVGMVRRLRRGINGLGARCRCCFCETSFWKFSKYRGGWEAVSSYLRELDWVSSEFDHFWCPFCRSHDRERHLKYFFDALDFWRRFEGAVVLHLAPEKHLGRCIESCGPERYLQGDLVPVRETIEVVDVTDIHEEDDSFDVVLCNHVLEHVPEDAKALGELFRVLKPGGVAILQTPFAAKLGKTRERDPEVTTEAQCLEFYGQEDHVRLYGTDLMDRIGAAGFELDLQTHDAVLPELDCGVAGVSRNERLILARKA